MRSRTVSLVLAALSFSAAFVPAAGATSLRFLADANIPTGSKVAGTNFGGLSGLAYDPVREELLILSDDKSELQPARFYRAKVAVASGRVALDPFAFTTLTRADGTTFPKGSIDPEAIARLDARRLFVSSEGAGKANPRIPPAIFELDADGRVVRSLPVPGKFIPEKTGKPTRGVVDNCAFESLAITPSRRSLFAATECPLVQDDTPASFKKSGVSRILQYRLVGEHRIPSAEYAYVVEPNARPEGMAVDFGNGISEMLALDERSLLVVERGAASGPRDLTMTRIRIFKATLGGAATNVAGVAALKGRRGIRPVKKELVLDLDAILPRLDPKHASTDNIESMTFGPRLPNGHRTLLLLSDDNFNPFQRTQVLAFELLE